MGDLNRDMHTGRQTCEDGLRDGVMHSQAKECYRFQQTTSSRERGMDQFLPLSFSLSLPGLQRTSPADMRHVGSELTDQGLDWHPVLEG